MLRLWALYRRIFHPFDEARAWREVANCQAIVIEQLSVELETERQQAHSVLISQTGSNGGARWEGTD